MRNQHPGTRTATRATPASPLAPHPAPWVLVSAGFHELGGQAKATAALADHLLEGGVPVHLVAHDLDPRFVDRPGCTVHAVRRPAGADVLGVLWLRRHGRAIAHRVCAANPRTRVLVNGGCCLWGDINWVHYLHGAWRPSATAVSWPYRVKETLAGTIFRRHERQALRQARLVIANSERTRTDVIRHTETDPDSVHTVYYGADSSWGPPSVEERATARAWLDQPEGRPLAVFVGGFGHDERKGFDSLWQAWQALCRQSDWDVDLLALGGGARLAYWQERVAQAGLGRRIRLLGVSDRVHDALAAADLLVSPVRYEPYGLNVQEAVCRGVPALVSARAGATEHYLASLSDMILPDPDDWRDLAQRLRSWRADIAGWRERSRFLSDTLRRYTWREMAARIVSLAESVDQV
jgi:glycosyltransferase involved in cell wall biosynthesis